MENEVFVKYIYEKEDFDILIDLYKQKEINSTFSGYRSDRLLASEYSFLIYLGDIPIGFILCVRERSRRNNLSIDMAILEKYRNLGYGKKSLEIFRDYYLLQIPDQLIVEVDKNNVPANGVKSVFDLEYVETIDSSNIYKVKR